MAFLGDTLFTWLFKEEDGFRKKPVLSLLSRQSPRLFIRIRSKSSGRGKFVAGLFAGEGGYTYVLPSPAHMIIPSNRCVKNWLLQAFMMFQNVSSKHMS